MTVFILNFIQGYLLFLFALRKLFSQDDAPVFNEQLLEEHGKAKGIIKKLASDQNVSYHSKRFYSLQSHKFEPNYSVFRTFSISKESNGPDNLRAHRVPYDEIKK